MFENLEVFRMAQGLAAHAAGRQAAIARNIANADTPGYRARDLPPFAETLRAGVGGDMTVTRRGHMGRGTAQDAARGAEAALPAHRPRAAAPNGNTVSLEQEMMEAALVRGSHDRALAIYRSALTVLRTSVNGGR